MAGKNKGQLDQQLLSPDFFANPYPVYHQLRTEDAVHWCEPWNCWGVSRYDEIVAALRQDGRKFSVVGQFGSHLDALPESVQPRFQAIKQHYSVGLLHSDPPDHTRLRGLINKAFTTRVVEKMRPQIEATVDELLDTVERTGRMDVIRDFAFPLPAIVTANLVGMPPKDRHQFNAWSDDISAFSASNCLKIEVAERAQRSLLSVRAYLLDIFAEGRKQPRDDLISRLVSPEREAVHRVPLDELRTSHRDDERPSEGELISTCVTFLVGGHETTTALIGSGLLALFQYPNQLRELRDDPTAMMSAIEEFLRYATPNQRINRLVKEDVEIEGRQIKCGQRVMFLLGSANRDPAQFPDADRLDIRRDPNHHLAFAMGPHFCIGASLARLEATIAFDALLSRFPKVINHGHGPWLWLAPPSRAFG